MTRTKLPTEQNEATSARGVSALKLPPYIAPTRVAALLDLDPRRIYDLVHTGDLACIRIGKRGMRICRESLLAWLERGGCHGDQSGS